MSYIKGEWNFICPRCGYKVKSHRIRKEWTGLVVCDKCYDPKNPADYPPKTLKDPYPVSDISDRPATDEFDKFPITVFWNNWHTKWEDMTDDYWVEEAPDPSDDY